MFIRWWLAFSFFNTIQIRRFIDVPHTWSPWTSSPFTINDIDSTHLFSDLKGFLGRNVSSKNKAREVNPRLKTHLHAYMLRRMRTMYGTRAKTKKSRKKKCAHVNVIRKMNVSLKRNADVTSKPCFLQHFGFPPFSSISSKYCKGCKFQNKGDYKTL